ncbi:MAG: MerR family transcriptional regulator [Myxococcales bacterium]|nr:MerR family transcriptional regulator [Myxococcales bacterium]
MTVTAHRETELPLDALVDQANALLARLPEPVDGRVAAATDARGVRYYQSLGVVDRPTRYDGRKAIYGYRHLLQIVCAKALQRQGHSLAQVQRALAAAPLAALEAAALDAVGSGPAPSPAAQAPASAPRPLVAVELAPGVTVTLDPARVPDVQAMLARLAAALTSEDAR